MVQLIDYHEISDHQQSWGYEDDPWKGPGHLCWWPLIKEKERILNEFQRNNGCGHSAKTG
jgi:hypothetical protein